MRHSLLAAGGCGDSGHGAETNPEKGSDAAILNEGLSRELTALDAYTRGNGLLRGRERALGRQLRAQEQEYVDALTKAIRGLGGDTEAEAEELDFSQVKDQAAFLALAYELESAARDFYVDQAAASLHGRAAHARHLACRRARSGTLRCCRPVGDDPGVTAPLYAIGRFCSRHHYPTIAVWLIVAVVLVVAGQASGDKTNDNLTLPGTGSTMATELLEDNLPEQAYGSNPLAFESKAGTLTEPKYAQAIEESIKRLQAMHEVNSAISPLSKEGVAAGLLSKDKTVAYTPVVLGVGPGELTEEQAQAVLDAAEPAEKAGLETSVGAYVGQQLSKPDTGISDAIGIAAAIVILLFAFGTATAMVMPIGSAIIGLAISLSIIRLLENAIEVPSVAATLATMIGLGVGIDYALFIVTRHKLQLGEGMELRESIARATATAGGAVVFAGFTVVIALCSLAFAGIPLVSTLGFTAAIAVVVAVCAAATLLPAMLGALGPHIDSMRVPGTQRRPGRQRAARLAPLGTRCRRPALALGDRGAGGPRRPGAADLPARARPERPQRPAQVDHRPPELRLADQGLRPGRQRAAADHLASSRRRRKRRRCCPSWRKQVDAAADVAAVSEPTLDKAGTVAVFTVISKSAPWADETVSLVEGLRDTTIPQALQGTDAAAYVGGQTAGYIDLATQIADKLPLMIAIVVGLSFIVLLLAFRSLLVPGQGGGDEPALGRRRLRRRDRGLPARLGRRR